MRLCVLLPLCFVDNLRYNTRAGSGRSRIYDDDDSSIIRVFISFFLLLFFRQLSFAQIGRNSSLDLKFLILDVDITLINNSIDGNIRLVFEQ